MKSDKKQQIKWSNKKGAVNNLRRNYIFERKSGLFQRYFIFEKFGFHYIRPCSKQGFATKKKQNVY